MTPALACGRQWWSPGAASREKLLSKDQTACIRVSNKKAEEGALTHHDCMLVRQASRSGRPEAKNVGATWDIT